MLYIVEVLVVKSARDVGSECALGEFIETLWICFGEW